MTASADTAALLPIGDVFLGDLDGPSDSDWIKAELTAGATYELTLTTRDPDGAGPRHGAGDTVLEIYNRQRELITSADDRPFVDGVLPPGGFHPQLSFTPADGGVHYFRVSAFISRLTNKDYSGGYRLELAETRPPPEPEPDPAPETRAPATMVNEGADAARLDVGGVHRGVLNGPADSDWIRAELTGGTAYILALASRDPDGAGPLSGASDTELKIYNGSDDLVASADDQALVNGVLPAGGFHPRLSFTPSADGDYFFRVSSYIYPGADNSGGYRLELAEDPAPPPAPDPGPAPGGPDPDTGGPTDDGPRLGKVFEGGAGDDTGFGGAGDDTGFGGAGDDTGFGGAGDDTGFGGAGDDTGFGGAGNDTGFGGAGNDILVGGAGDDTGYGGAGDDQLYGDAGDDTGFGGAGDDQLYGGPGNDNLRGGEGNDILVGGEGNDVLVGGPGADIFVFALGDSLGSGDVIMDYTASEDDALDLMAFNIDPDQNLKAQGLRIAEGRDADGDGARDDTIITLPDGGTISLLDDPSGATIWIIF